MGNRPNRRAPTRQNPTFGVRPFNYLVFAAVFSLLGLLAYVAARHEIRFSTLQGRYFTSRATKFTWEVAEGTGKTPNFTGGPYDRRMGYTRLGEFTAALTGRGWKVESQAVISGEFEKLVAKGAYPVYEEKGNIGLEVRGRDGVDIFTHKPTSQVYPSFEEIPRPLVATLLFVEDRRILSKRVGTGYNPAVDWHRFIGAVPSAIAGFLGLELKALGLKRGGASTLATQVEKYRHSPGGRTEGPVDKLRQMEAASTRAYLYGRDTSQHRRNMVLSYVNSVPFGAAPGTGEIFGFAEAASVFYGISKKDLAAAFKPGTPREITGRVLRAIVSLVAAQRRPAYYLSDLGSGDLARLTDGILYAMGRAKVLSPEAVAAARTAHVNTGRDAQPNGPSPQPPTAAEHPMRKAANATRISTASKLGLGRRLYDLDRLHLTVDTTFDAKLQALASSLLRQMATREGARGLGLYGHRLLTEEVDPSRLVYALSLYERRDDGTTATLVRTDSLGGQMDINESGRMELGSTAKLRTLVSYLELAAAEYERVSSLGPEERAADLARISRINARKPGGFEDTLGLWVHGLLREKPGIDLRGALDRALARRFSASPSTLFHTGGGLHRFSNFDTESDTLNPTVAEAFVHSINLPFVRIMREQVTHLVVNGGSDVEEAFPEDKTRSTPTRAALLRAHLQREVAEASKDILGKARSLAGAGNKVGIPEEGEHPSPGSLPQRPKPEDLLEAGLPRPSQLMNPRALAAADAGSFITRDPASLPEGMREAYAEARLKLSRGGIPLSIADAAYLSRANPVAIWMARTLSQDPGLSPERLTAAAVAAEAEIHRWAHARRAPRRAINPRVRAELERRAFLKLARLWTAQGYPYTNLVPSYGTALGSSGDRPGALAELAGAVAGGGVLARPTIERRITLGAGTPYQTSYTPPPPAPLRRMRPEVADAVRGVMVGVVARGTATRLGGALREAAGEGGAVVMGGKTGTGDNRHVLTDQWGKVIGSTKRNRTATFVFFIGTRHFGAITVMALDREVAEASSFTSSLPVQAMKTILPKLLPLLSEVGN